MVFTGVNDLNSRQSRHLNCQLYIVHCQLFRGHSSAKRKIICTGGSVAPAKGRLLQTLLVSLDHLLDHLAADGTGLTGGQVTVVTVLQVDAHF